MLISLRSKCQNEENGMSMIKIAGGKAFNLMRMHNIEALALHVPNGFALTVDFFETWVDKVFCSAELKEVESKLKSNADLEEACIKLKQFSKSLPWSQNQSDALEKIKIEMRSWDGLCAVRSSATEEDGCEASFAGIFDSKLGVVESTLEEAVRECFSSFYSHRAFSYQRSRFQSAGAIKEVALICQEMVNSLTAGVAFSANPVNSDLDELVIDSCWGLGESVVDGSIEADHFVWDKINQVILHKKLGSKIQEKKLDIDVDGGISTIPVHKDRQSQSTLSDDQLKELANLVCLVESAYKMPMDVEWAYQTTTSSSSPQLKLLQARPITALYRLDENLITSPGEPRVLYYDFNIASEATTTSPFTRMDLAIYNKMCAVMMGVPDINIFPSDPSMFWFSGNTRQYINMNILFKFISKDFCSKQCQMLDPYLADIFASKDCDEQKYRYEYLPNQFSLSNTWYYVKQFPFWSMYKTSSNFKADPEKSKNEYLAILKDCFHKASLVQSNSETILQENGLQMYLDNMFESVMPSFHEEMGAIFSILPMFKELDEKRRNGNTEEERTEYCALCSGYEGDELMEINIAMYQLAQLLPKEIWLQYNHSTLGKLASRIQSNIDGKTSDVPVEFLAAWKTFLKDFGYDGQDQVFVSSTRYIDSPEILLSKLIHNIDDDIKNPAMTQKLKLEDRREIMKLHEERAKKKWFSSVKSIQQRNKILDHLMWIRNAPKLHLSRVIAMVRAVLLQIQDKFIDDHRLDEYGDIFHLDVDHVNRAMIDKSFNLKEIVQCNKLAYEKAVKSNVCPLLVDSRCRILKPDARNNEDKNKISGTPISPGSATGKVRLVHNTTDPLEKGEVLVAVVTDPAWTPLFIGASAVILQIGGVLQHGALCSRELGKPAVSGIYDVMDTFKNGMIVTVDGNTGVVTIH